MKKTASALALLIAAALNGCAARTTPASGASATEKTAQPAVSGVQQRALADGLHEVAPSPAGDMLYAASAEGFKDVQGGVVYKLDPKTPKALGLSHTGVKSFGMAISPDDKTVCVTNSPDGGLSVLSTADGKVKNHVLFPEHNPESFPYGAYQVLLHNSLLYIGTVADPAVIQMVDAETLKLRTRTEDTGKWIAGLHYSEVTRQIYTANGGSETLIINPRNQRVEKRWQLPGGQPALLLNMAKDAQTGRLFVTGSSKAKTTLVLDIHTGKLLKKLDVGGSLAVKFSAKRDEIYITQRDSGGLLSLDAIDHSMKKSWDLPPDLSSLLLSADGQTLFVIVKQKFSRDHSTSAPDNVVCIDLNKQ